MSIEGIVGDVAENYASKFDPLRSLRQRSHYWKQTPECDAFRAVVKTVLMYPRNFRWTTQGFGFLRTYLPFGSNAKRFRLNVWDNALTTPNVSIIHDHPWGFTSWVLSGNFRNTRLVEDHYNGDEYQYRLVKCGEGGCALGTPAPIRLRALPTEHYKPGDIYQQSADEIHMSAFDSGTVTLNDRVGDTEQARVFWLAGLSWVDAKAREATAMEVAKSTMLALERWEDEIIRP